MHANIILDGDKVGEVYVNPFSHTYDGDVEWINERLNTWEDHGVNPRGAVEIDSDEHGKAEAETYKESDKEKLKFVKRNLGTGLFLKVKIVE